MKAAKQFVIIFLYYDKIQCKLQKKTDTNYKL